MSTFAPFADRRAALPARPAGVHGVSSSRGFTMTELMIAVAIVAMLTAIAVPTYADQVRRSARSEMQAFITTVATRQTQFIVDRRRYADSLSTMNLSIPSSLTDKYTVAVTAADGPPPTYTITATAKGGQTKDKCPTLTLDYKGNRSPAGCW